MANINDRGPLHAGDIKNSCPVHAGAEITARIEDLAYGGSGVARAGGWVVMVRGAFPGDLVRVRLGRRRKGYYQAEQLAIVEPSPDRIPPECPHVEICGGCPLQGLRPDAQTHLKAKQATETLRRIGEVVAADVAAPWSAPSPWFYRNKMEFTFGQRPWVDGKTLASGAPLPSGPALGLHPRGRFEGVFDVTACRLQSPLSNRIVAAAREIARRRALSIYTTRRDEGLLRHLVVRESSTSDDRLVVIVVRYESQEVMGFAQDLAAAVPEITGIVASVNLRRAAIAQGDYELPLIGRPTWRERLADCDYVIGASSFFQTQTRGGEALVAEILEHGGLRAGDRVLDLYCGVGALSLPVARRVAHVLGVEAQPGAVSEARANADRNNIRNASFLCAPVETKDSPEWMRESWDAVLIDPPRSGLHPRALERLAAMQPPRIICVSCNPATLARDAGSLVRAGYRASRLRVFDLFPQTPHLESVLVLER